MLIVTHEDRDEAWVGLQLLVLSLRRWCPAVSILVSRPGLDRGCAAWLESQGRVEIVDEPALAGRGWNAKPALLVRGLDAGHEEVVWLDTDVILAADPRPLIQGRDPGTLLVCDEHFWGVHHGGSLRTELWGLVPARDMPGTASTGVVRVTPCHRGLLAAWAALLDCPRYVSAQTRPWPDRPVHMVGDQDVLTALLGSRRFAHVPVAYLRRGKDLVLNVGPGGYTVAERLANLGRGLPPVIHCTGPKPWEAGPVVSPFRDAGGYYLRAFLELCEYTQVARGYSDQIDGDTLALDVRTVLARLCRFLACGRSDLQALPIAAFHGMARRIKRSLVGTSWSRPEANMRAGDRLAGEAILDRLGDLKTDNAR